MTYRYVALDPGVGPNGQPLAFGDEIAITSSTLESEFLISSGKVVPIPAKPKAVASKTTKTEEKK